MVVNVLEYRWSHAYRYERTHVSGSERERERVCVCVREREREREWYTHQFIHSLRNIPIVLGCYHFCRFLYVASFSLQYMCKNRWMYIHVGSMNTGYHSHTHIFNPLRMRSRVTVVCSCVCLSVCLLPFYLLHCWVILHKCWTTWINWMSAKFLTRGFC